jgi:hypothetical protein
MLLQYAPGTGIYPAVFDPEIIAAAIIVVNKDIAARNIHRCESGKRKIDKAPPQPTPAMSMCNGQMIYGTRATIVPAEDSANDVAICVNSHRAKARIAIHKNGYCLKSIGLIEPEAFYGQPQGVSRWIVRYIKCANVSHGVLALLPKV